MSFLGFEEDNKENLVVVLNSNRQAVESGKMVIQKFKQCLIKNDIVNKTLWDDRWRVKFIKEITSSLIKTQEDHYDTKLQLLINSMLTTQNYKPSNSVRSIRSIRSHGNINNNNNNNNSSYKYNYNLGDDGSNGLNILEQEWVFYSKLFLKDPDLDYIIKNGFDKQVINSNITLTPYVKDIIKRGEKNGIIKNEYNLLLCKIIVDGDDNYKEYDRNNNNRYIVKIGEKWSAVAKYQIKIERKKQFTYPVIRKN